MNRAPIRRRARGAHFVGAMAIVSFGALLGGASLGCHNLTVHTFVGQHYDKTNDCLDPKGVIDVVEGTAHGTCTGVRCFVSQTKDPKGGATDGEVFVSTSCEPAPDFRDGTLDPDGSACADALLAYARGKDGACPTTT